MRLRLLEQGPADGGAETVREHFDLLETSVRNLGPESWTVNLALVDDAHMAALNGDFRSRPGVTDVLSFSYLEDDGPGSPELAGGEGYAARDLWTEAGLPDGLDQAVGEIILAPGFVGDRCRANDWPVRDELCLLVVHGGLHILGWDHETDHERDAMQAVEKEILDGCGISHPLLGRS